MTLTETPSKNGHHKTSQNGTPTAPKNGEKRGENGKPVPPVEHRFRPGNPGGPGRPKGSRSMQKIIRQMLYDPNQPFDYPKKIAQALLVEALAGNTNAIRIVLALDRRRGDK